MLLSLQEWSEVVLAVQLAGRIGKCSADYGFTASGRKTKSFCS